ncbi:hypothetical protein [uncultured Pseudodesulfovibrio sp.]|uniref:hypothetical protein n=1 Tax=uncultured Pseudodesulfovibrio sp. TaxID=2035858 RepID=UPI0029C64702|nr:hypothetical protein [uncultured Pseudodesulfovibrio sp.]
MPSLGGGGNYGGNDPSGGAGRDSGGYGMGGGDSRNHDNDRNSMWAKDPKTGRWTQVGAPSRMGGMMTTAAGYNMNRAADRANGGLGLQAYGIDSKQSPFYSGYYENLQRNIKEDAQGRRASEASVRDAIDRSSLGWTDRVKALDAFKEGNLGALDALGIDTSKMQETHRSGGLMGMIGDFFGAKKNDVDTMAEVEDATPEWGYSPLGLGIGVLAPAVAEQVYGVTENVPAAMAAKKATDYVSSKMTPSVPRAANYATKALGVAGVPVAGALANAAGLINQARDLNYIGQTNPYGPARANENYGSEGTGGMMSGPEAVTASLAKGEGYNPDLAGQWQYLFGVPWYV